MNKKYFLLLILFLVIVFFIFCKYFFNLIFFSKDEKIININYAKEENIENLYYKETDLQIDKDKIISEIEKNCPEYLSENAKTECINEKIKKLENKIYTKINDLEKDFSIYQKQKNIFEERGDLPKTKNKNENFKEDFLKSLENINTICKNNAEIYILKDKEFSINICKYLKLNEEVIRYSLYYTVLVSVPSESLESEILSLRKDDFLKEFKEMLLKIRINKNKAYDEGY